jgi:hypothetical protein
VAAVVVAADEVVVVGVVDLRLVLVQLALATSSRWVRSS